MLQIGEVARLAEALEGVRRTTADGLAQWRYHGMIVWRGRAGRREWRRKAAAMLVAPVRRRMVMTRLRRLAMMWIAAGGADLGAVFVPVQHRLEDFADPWLRDSPRGPGRRFPVPG